MLTRLSNPDIEFMPLGTSNQTANPAPRILWAIFMVWAFCLSCTKPVTAADLALDLAVSSVNHEVTATISNQSNQAVALDNFRIVLNGQHYQVFTADTLAAHTKKSYQLSVQMPALPGSYLLASKVNYHNDNHLVSLQNVGIFYVQQAYALPSSCQFGHAVLKKNQPRLRLDAEQQFDWQLFLPDEVQLQQQLSYQHTHVFTLQAMISGLRNHYQVYAGAERVIDGRHEAALCNTPLEVDSQFGDYPRGRIPDVMLYALTGLSLFGVLLIKLFVENRRDKASKLGTYGCYLARLVLLGCGYLVLRHAPVCLDGLSASLPLDAQPAWLALLSDHFWGDNYRYFFAYAADVYYLAGLLIGLPYFLSLKKPDLLENDKYYALLTSLFSLPRLLLGRRPVWGPLSRLGLLTMLVKLFFLPYMLSWSLQNIHYMASLVQQEWTGFDVYNEFFKTLFMLLDTGFFAVGYLLESRRLGSEIRSVDPTFTGWLVCLWCYPPFNGFSFQFFDVAIVPIHIDTPALVQTLLLGLITLLWGVYSVASVNLGFKASNLTNRGVVRHGLYRYVRHPAYSCKVFIWTLQGVFFGQFTLGILLAFATVYWLRAITEERHLLMDSDYLDYKQQVPWRFIPGVW